MFAPFPSHWPLVLTRTDSHQAAEPAGPGGLIVVCGSLRLVDETRTALAPRPA
ncbi:hypothetical protein AB0B50_20160 [Streptomyces sp. NPDC041068]|uniref:hypothetical protein n=1 Tax=Streptomyces sp. NPDC041068 TaxID=3155130 RepID=UPI0033C47495